VAIDKKQEPVDEKNPPVKIKKKTPGKPLSDWKTLHKGVKYRILEADPSRRVISTHAYTLEFKTDERITKFGLETKPDLKEIRSLFRGINPKK